MKIIPLAHPAIGKLALIGLLLSPFIFTSSYAAELVGKPVPIGGQAAASSAIQEPAHSAPIASQPAEVPEAPVVPSAPATPVSSDIHEDVQQAMEDMRENFHNDIDHFDDFDMSPELLIPIVAMSLLFGGPILLIIILVLLHYRAKGRRQKNINANIDKLLAAGRDIPVELLLGEEATAVRRNVSGEVTTVYQGSDSYMHKGLKNIGLGAGWLVFLTIAFSIKIGAFGFIFIGLGLSQVLIWKLSNPGPVPNTNTISNTEAARIQE